MVAASNPRRTNGNKRNKVLAAIRASGEPCWICELAIDPTIKAGEPCACEADELVPVSKGGSPYDRSNIAPAHRCCNNWRKNKSVAYVEAIRAKVQACVSYSTPQEFVSAAKSVSKGIESASKPQKAHHTTSW